MYFQYNHDESYTSKTYSNLIYAGLSRVDIPLNIFWGTKLGLDTKEFGFGTKSLEFATSLTPTLFLKLPLFCHTHYCSSI